MTGICREGPEARRACMAREGRKRLYFIVAMGCQMNVRDSETLAGMLEEMGFSRAGTREDADLILYLTCCVRENAENKALGNVIWLKELKKIKPELVICVGGCMMQVQGVAESLIARYPFIDLIFGTHNLHRFPELLCRVLEEKRPVAEILDGDGDIVEGLPVKRGSAHSAFVNVMYGCDNFCSYCIVPYVRGRERSRSPEEILREVRGLVEGGTQEVVLLGQNVNSYGGGGNAFAALLRSVHETGIRRIRFMTSHPKDLSEELIACYGDLPNLAGHLHLPVQAGSDRVLAAMNRRYTREHNLKLVEKLRGVRPDVGLTTDIIVGFPGETRQDFRETLSLVREVGYDAAFTFIYSPRAGTGAYGLPDPVSMEEKTEWIEELIALQREITGRVLKAQIGSCQEVLADAPSARDPGWLGGKTGRGLMVNFPGAPDMIGRFVQVDIGSAGRNTLRGKVREEG